MYDFGLKNDELELVIDFKCVDCIHDFFGFECLSRTSLKADFKEPP